MRQGVDLPNYRGRSKDLKFIVHASERKEVHFTLTLQSVLYILP